MKRDNVNNPKHYELNGLDVETIKIVEALANEYDGFSAFCIGNIMKYLIRAKKKNGVEDLEKAMRYLEWLINKEKMRGEEE